MAIFNEILVGRWNAGLSRLFGMKGGPPAPALASEVIPYLALPTFDDNLAVFGYQRFGTAGSIAANVANASQMRLRNPLAANVIAVITHFWANSALATTLNFFINEAATPDLASTTTTVGFDGRGPARAALISSQTSAVAAGGQGAQFFTRRINAANQEQEYLARMPIVLWPGSFFEVDTGAVNQDLVWNISWIERYLDESERIGG